MNAWERHRRAFERGPGSAMFSLFILSIVIAFPLALILSGFVYVGGWFVEAGQITQKEFGPRSLLEKYEWFKNASASLDSHRANLEAYKDRLNSLKESYSDVTRSQWSRTDKEDWNQWHTEALGIVATYNRLAAEYNANMAKFNWKFTNTSSLPQGITQVLPKEYQEYQFSL